MPCGRKTWPEGSMTGVACCADDIVPSTRCQSHSHASGVSAWAKQRDTQECWRLGSPVAAAWQDTGYNKISICALPALQMAVPTHQLPPTPPGVSAASTGAVAFQSWLAEEEEEWRLSQRLEASCPKEFKCPISLDIMQDPIILVRPVQQHLTEATHPLLEQEHCPLQCTLRAPVDATV